MNKIVIVAIIVAIVALLGAGAYVYDSYVHRERPVTAEKGIVITSIERQDRIFADIKIKGEINGDGWIAFEGQAGVVKFLDKDNKFLGYAPLMIIGEWMVSPPLNFEASMRMTPEEADSVTELEFNNENPSGLAENNKIFILPVKIIETTSETMIIKVYFGKTSADSTCNVVFPTDRIISKTEAVAKAALEELLNGPTNNEKTRGFFTSINQGVKIQSLTIVDGVAKVDFDEQLEFQVGGSCMVAAIRAQITQTLKQFSSVKSVVISIDGRTEDILQP